MKINNFKENQKRKDAKTDIDHLNRDDFLKNLLFIFINKTDDVILFSNH